MYHVSRFAPAGRTLPWVLACVLGFGFSTDLYALEGAGGGGPVVFQDDFERGDGPIDGWTVFRGDWNIASGELVTGPTAAEHWIWSGDPPISGPENVIFSFKMRFLSPGTNPGIGRHAGAMFFSNEPTERFAGTSRGYVVWWIDRASDFGISLARFDGAGFTFLHEGTFGAIADPPLNWRIEVIGASIKVFGDDVLYVDVVDDTYRDGLFGLWTWAGGQEVAFDDVVIREPAVVLSPCFEIAPGPRITDKPLKFDGSCSVATAGTGTIVRYDWDFGDGDTASGVEVEHTYTAAGTYTVRLEIEDEDGNVAAGTKEVTIAPVTLGFSDDFERADGPVDGWTVAAGPSWALSGGALTAGPTGEEHWIWAGDPPLFAPPNSVWEFDYAFLTGGSNPVVGRHGGFQFHCNRPTVRSGGGAFSGYFVDWIDRAQDRGVRLTRVDNGAFVELVRGQGAAAPADPPAHWRVEVEGAVIRVFGDDVLYIEQVDDTYRGGFFGFWTWAGDQNVAIDNLVHTGDPLAACFDWDPALPVAGETITFDGGCSMAFGGGGREIVAWEWDFDYDGVAFDVDATGAAVETSFSPAGTYTVALRVTDNMGAMSLMAADVLVATDLDGFTDCFDRAAGAPDGWTGVLGDWSITQNESLAVATTTGAPDAEAWVYAGDPPGLLQGDVTIEFTLPSVFFTGNPADPVGRHFGVMFYANTLTTNRFAADSSGYTFWWIDRANDFGLNLARWDGPALNVLHAGTFGALADPPRVWRIEVSGPTIRLFGDGVLYIEVEDDTYREGFFAFWVWKNMAVEFDSVRIWSTEEPPPCPGETGHLAGDCTGDGTRDIADVVCYVRHLVAPLVLPRRPASPVPCPGPGFGSPFNAAIFDVDGNGAVNPLDAVHLARYLFAGGPPPVQGEDCFPLPEAWGCDANPGCP